MLIPSLHNEHILLVEDDRSMILLLQNILEPTGVKISLAHDGEEAVELIRSNPSISLVLMDIQMQGMGGIDAARAIREIVPSIPIIAQTSFNTAEDKVRCQRAEFTGFISKPVDIRLLYNTLWSHLKT